MKYVNRYSLAVTGHVLNIVILHERLYLSHAKYVPLDKITDYFSLVPGDVPEIGDYLLDLLVQQLLGLDFTGLEEVNIQPFLKFHFDLLNEVLVGARDLRLDYIVYIFIVNFI